MEREIKFQSIVTYCLLHPHHCFIFLLSCLGYARFDRTNRAYRRAGNTGFSWPEGSYWTSWTSWPPCRLPTPTNSSPVTHPITQNTSHCTMNSVTQHQATCAVVITLSALVRETECLLLITLQKKQRGCLPS
jgi:hypothetical protein